MIPDITSDSVPSSTPDPTSAEDLTQTVISPGQGSAAAPAASPSPEQPSRTSAAGTFRPSVTNLPHVDPHNHSQEPGARSGTDRHSIAAASESIADGHPQIFHTTVSETAPSIIATPSSNGNEETIIIPQHSVPGLGFSEPRAPLPPSSTHPTLGSGDNPKGGKTENQATTITAGDPTSTQPGVSIPNLRSSALEIPISPQAKPPTPDSLANFGTSETKTQATVVGTDKPQSTSPLHPIQDSTGGQAIITDPKQSQTISNQSDPAGSADTFPRPFNPPRFSASRTGSGNPSEDPGKLSSSTVQGPIVTAGRPLPTPQGSYRELSPIEPKKASTFKTEGTLVTIGGPSFAPQSSATTSIDIVGKPSVLFRSDLFKTSVSTAEAQGFVTGLPNSLTQDIDTSIQPVFGSQTIPTGSWPVQPVLSTITGNPKMPSPLAVTIEGTTLTIKGLPTAISGSENFFTSATLMIGTDRLPLSFASDGSIIATVGGSLVTAHSSAVEVAGSTLTPHGSAHTISGIYVSLQSTALVIGSSTVDIPSSFPKADRISTEATIMDQTLTYQSGTILVDGTTLYPDSGEIFVNSIKISATALIIGSSTFAIATPMPSPILAMTVSGQALIVSSDEILVDGMTLRPSNNEAPAASESGRKVSINVAPAITMTDQILTIQSGEIFVNGLTLHPDKSDISVNRTGFAIGSSHRWTSIGSSTATSDSTSIEGNPGSLNTSPPVGSSSPQTAGPTTVASASRSPQRVLRSVTSNIVIAVTTTIFSHLLAV